MVKKIVAKYEGIFYGIKELDDQILKLILEKFRTEKEIIKILGYEKETVKENLEQMIKEHLIKKEKGKFFV